MSWFKRRVRIASTGHAGDDQVLAEIARRSDLSKPREWEHFLYFPDEMGARTATQDIQAAGWTVDLDRRDDDGQWLVIARQHQAVTSPEAVRAARQFFEEVEAAHPGAQYDGWGATAG